MLVTVGRYFDPWEAHILRARLDAEGIPASVAGDQLVMANWPMSVALAGVALQVPGEHLAEARELVQAYHAGVLQQDLEAEHPDAADACPRCGAGEVAGVIPMGQRALAVATFLVAGATFPTSASRLSCGACGHRWWYGDRA